MTDQDRRRAPLTARLAAGGAWAPRTIDDLRADTELRAVLEGRRHLLFDGAMGSMLQAAGLEAGALPELLNLEDRQAVERVHAAYVAAGAEVVTTNTFGANELKLGSVARVEDVYAAGVAAARAAGAPWVAGDIGPLGTLLRPLGTLSFDEAYAAFARMARAAEVAGADLLVIETMTDLAEMKAAVLAAKEHTSLPIFATMTFEADGRTFLGTPPEVAAVALDALGADVIGINCSLGPTEIRPFVQRMLAVTAKPIMVQANAGLPHVENGRTVYSIRPEAYAAAVAEMVADGVNVIGGCCGTTPEYIRLLAGVLEDARGTTGGTAPRADGTAGHTEPAAAPDAAPACPAPRNVAPGFTCASAQQLVRLPEHSRAIAVIGERLNPTGKKRLQAALRAGDLDYLAGQGISQQEQGADILDLNVGLPGLDEPATMERASEQLQATVVLPLQFDSTDPVALEAAVRRYPGKPIINSVNGSAESLAGVLPLAAHYGCDLVGLTLDEAGIPATAEARFAIAERIVHAAENAGIPRDRLLIDCLVMTASTNQHQVMEILRAVAMVKERLGVRTTLGVSNVSFGLPARELINATFLAAALGAGLDAPIMNPGSARYMDVIRSFRVLNAEDEDSTAFIERYAEAVDPYRAAASERRSTAAATAITDRAPGENGAAAEAGATTSAAEQAATDTASTADSAAAALRHAILTGRRPDAATACETLLAAGTDPMALINDHLIPALDEVGVRFDAGTLFLPQLMAAAEAARAGFDVVRAALPEAEAGTASKGAICLATVKGDIHDIGKNIVKMLLDNYGYTVYDLGRDVAPEDVLAAVRARDVELVGLSALMTTTVVNMEATIELLHREAPGVQVIVGGAVLTPEYARQIGADFYAKDAAETARICERVFG